MTFSGTKLTQRCLSLSLGAARSRVNGIIATVRMCVGMLRLAARHISLATADCTFFPIAVWGWALALVLCIGIARWWFFRAFRDPTPPLPRRSDRVASFVAIARHTDVALAVIAVCRQDYISHIPKS